MSTNLIARVRGYRPDGPTNYGSFSTKFALTYVRKLHSTFWGNGAIGTVQCLFNNMAGAKLNGATIFSSLYGTGSTLLLKET